MAHTHQSCTFKTSLVVQWIRIHLPLQGTWVQSLVREDSACHRRLKPTHHNDWAWAPKACALRKRSPAMRGLCTATKCSPCSPQPEKAREQQLRPTVTKINKWTLKITLSDILGDERKHTWQGRSCSHSFCFSSTSNVQPSGTNEMSAISRDMKAIPSCSSVAQGRDTTLSGEAELKGVYFKRMKSMNHSWSQGQG